MLNEKIALTADRPAPQADARVLQRQVRDRIAERRFGPRVSGDFRSLEQVKVSVVVLNYNGQAVLGRCLNCLFDQTHRNVEIIIVDNRSTDGSLEILDAVAADERVTVIRNCKNLGVAGGRNSGIERASGQVVAFIDNDGYADPNWLREGLKVLSSDATVGAVAPLVFFERNLPILNGAGGTANAQGYAGDRCFNEPLEFAQLAEEVLYPMGCGMIIRREVLDQITPLDAVLAKWFDDTEIGQRIWSRGYRVVTAPWSWVDHVFHTSESASKSPNWKKAWAFERARIRNTLKYLPSSDVENWWTTERRALTEAVLSGNLRRAVLATLVGFDLLLHCGSLLAIRRRFANGAELPGSLFVQTSGVFPPPMPDNRKYFPDPTLVTSGFPFDGSSEQPHLHYGWWESRDIQGVRSRAIAGTASLVIKLAQPCENITLRCAVSAGSLPLRVVVRPFGTIDSILEQLIDLNTGSFSDYAFAARLGPGTYEVLLSCSNPPSEQSVHLASLALS